MPDMTAHKERMENDSQAQTPLSAGRARELIGRRGRGRPRVHVRLALGSR